MKQPAITCALLFSALGTGCHLYNQGNDQLAHEMQKNFHDLHLATSVDDERKASSDMLQTEIDAARKFGDAMRDNRLAILLDLTVSKRDTAPCPARVATKGPAVASSSDSTLLCEIDTQLVRVAGSAGEAVMELVSGLDSLESTVTRAASNLRAELDTPAERKALPDVTCTTANVARLEKLDPAKVVVAPAAEREAFAKDLKSYCSACRSLLDTRDQLEKADGGELGKALKKLTKVRGALAAAQQKADALTQKDKAAKSEYDAATKNKTDIEKAEDALKKAKDAEKYLDTADEDTKQAIAALKSVKIFGDPAQLAVLQAREQWLTNGIRSLVKTTSDQYDKAHLDILVKLAGKEQQIEKESVLPTLLLEYEVVHGQLGVAKAAMQLADGEVAALQDQVTGLQRATTELVMAHNRLNDDPACKKSGPAAAIVGAELSDKDCGPAVAEALLHYANAFTLGFTPARVAHLRYIGAIDAGHLEQAAAVMAAWDAIVSVPIDQVATYHAGGLKPDTLAQVLVQIAGFAGLISTTAIQAAK